MRTNEQTLKATASGPAASGPAGEPLTLITGQESLEELRNIIIKFSEAGSGRQTHLHGPFRLMGSLSHDSLRTLVNGLTRKACLDLFQMEQNCHVQFGATDSVKNQGVMKP